MRTKTLFCPMVLTWGVLALCACGPSTGSDSGLTTEGSTSAPGTSTTETPDDSNTDAGTHTTASTDLVTSTSAGDAGTGQSSGDTASTGEVVPTCDPQPWFECDIPRNCEGNDHGPYACGVVSSYLDENGCPRPLCGRDDECPTGMRCHDMYVDCQRCTGGTPHCDLASHKGMPYCSCWGDGDCAGPSVCVPADLYPEGYCDP